MNVKSFSIGVSIGVFLFTPLCFGQYVGVPSTLWTATYGTDHYADPTLGTTKNAEVTSNMFWDYLSQTMAASQYKTQIGLTRYIFRTGTADLSTSFMADRNDLCDFVVVAGHGDKFGTMYFYDNSISVEHKALGQYYTKWLFLFECQTLNSFGVPYNASAAMVNYSSAFNGLHGIFGFASDVWGSYDYACGFLWLSTCETTPQWLWQDFFQRWIINKETMWSAWTNAVNDKLYHDMHYSGVIPAACGMTVMNKVLINGLTETINNVFFLPMPTLGYNAPPVSYCTVYGTPKY
jgi:Family of unknown function (DUF6345)